MFKFDVFISHNKKDKPWVRSFVNLLRDDAGMQVFFDEDSIKYGADIVKEMDDALDGSRFILPILTPASVNSK